MENRNILIGLGTGLVAGLIFGGGVGYYYGSNQGRPPAVAAAAAPAQPGMPPQGMAPQGPNPMELFNRITETKAALAMDASNVDAWVALGNDYFDTHQPQLAVDAYAQALKLSPKHPHAADILTDQGIMYRELKDYKKALANFQAAGKATPNHLPSLLNMGVVYAQDLHDKPAAKKAWSKIIEIAPDSPQAQQAKQFLAMP